MAVAQATPEESPSHPSCRMADHLSAIAVASEDTCDRTSLMPGTIAAIGTPKAEAEAGEQQGAAIDGIPASVIPRVVDLALESSVGSSAEMLPVEPTVSLDIDPDVVEDSPVLQRWLEQIPDVAADINADPAFRTRFRVGYATFPSTDDTVGIHLGVQDVFVGATRLTVSAEYARNGRGDREIGGADAQYYLLPLGWYGNIAPVIGYRFLETPEFTSQGVNVGIRLIVIPSRGGGADASLTQSWVAPGTDHEVGLTTISVGYAVTSTLRIATDIQLQNTPEGGENRFGVLLEWML